MELSKALKIELREKNGLAYERALIRALTRLDEKFAEWKAGAIEAFELGRHLHTFDRKEARELIGMYEDRHLSELNVCGAVIDGLIKEEELSADLLAALKPQIEYILSNRRERSAARKG